MRIMGLDYGTKTVGVAISDALGLTAQGIETIQRKEENKLRRTLARIEELVREYEVDTIVLGFPKHMNNDVGERAKKSLEFKEMLVRRTGLDVVMWDERLTTVEAERTLIEMLSSAKVTNPEDLIISQEELDDIERNIGHILSELEWEVLEGYLDGRSYQEMAEVTDRSVKSIDNALQRVKRKLEKYLEHRGFGFSKEATQEG